MIEVLEMLEDVLEGRIDDWSPEDRETAKGVAVDMARLQARLMAGQDVDPVELAFAKAAARNLATAATFTGAAAMLELLERLAATATHSVNPFMSG